MPYRGFGYFNWFGFNYYSSRHFEFYYLEEGEVEEEMAIEELGNIPVKEANGGGR